MKIVSSAGIKSVIRKELIREFKGVNFYFFGSIDEVGVHLEDAEVLITYGEDLEAEHIRKAKKLKWIMVISAGLDKMPFLEIMKRDIIITNAKGIHAKPIAEYVISAVLQVARNTKRLIKNEEEKKWDRRVPMVEINQQVLGVIGAGTIGTEIARVANAFGMKTIGVRRNTVFTEYFDEVYSFDNVSRCLEQADYVVSVLPSTNDTFELLDKTFFSMMKQNAVFINVGRGQTVNEYDLIEVLKNGVISHAFLDVFANEPLPKEHPFWEMEQVTITPHVSGISSQYQPRAFQIFKENLTRYLKGNGELLNVIDPKRGY